MPAQIYLGELPSDCRERDIEDFFRRHGRLDKINLKGTFAFVDFVDSRDAEDAIRDLDGRRLLGTRIRVERAKGTPHGSDKYEYEEYRRDDYRRDDYRRDDYRRDDRRGGGRERRRTPIWLDKYGPPTRTKYRVRVENLSSRCSWQDLKDYCRKGGNVTYAECHKDEDRVGIVEFETREDMERAIKKLDGSDINGRKITMKEEAGRKRSSSRRSRSRSRSRSKSRSRRGRSDSKSKSKSRSRSPRRRTRSPRSRSGEKNGDADEDAGKERSATPKAGSKRRSRSRSRSPRDSKSRSRGRSSSGSKSRSRSR